MTLTIQKKLLLGKVFMLVLLLTIVLTSLNSINNLSKTANRMEVEYLEISVLMDLRISCQHMLLSIKNYQIKGLVSEQHHFQQHLIETKKKGVEIKPFLLDYHDKKLINNFEKDILLVESLTQKLFKLNNFTDTIATGIIIEEINSILLSALVEINEVSMETEREMDKFIIANHQTNTKSKRSIIVIGIFTACSLIIGGFFFLRGIMRPINLLMQTTKKISSTNLNTNTDFKSHDEIGSLIESFNKMIGILDRTTVSRDYFNNILSRMDDSLIITDTESKITIVNQATLDLLGYTEEEIIGQPFEVLLGEKIDKIAFTKNTIISDLTKHNHLHNIYNTYYSKKGDKIPVLYSGSLMNDVKGSFKGIISIANHHPIENHLDTNSTPLGTKKDSDIHISNTIGEIPLTKREREIMKYIAEELSNQEISEKLFISVRTVETHRKNIMSKLHAKSVIALVKYAILNGII